VFADPWGRGLGRLVEGNDGAEYAEPENAKDLFELLKDYPSLNLDAVGLTGVDPNKRFVLSSLSALVVCVCVFLNVF
jgi:hypothetical protein